MAIEQRTWQDEIGRGDPADPTTWDAIDTARQDEAVQVVGDRTRGQEQTYVAVYPLKDARWSFYRSSPRTNGKSWVISTDLAICRNAARRMGEGSRLGIGSDVEAPQNGRSR